MANKWVNDDALLFFGSQFKIKIEEEIPTKTSDITNDSNFVSDANYVHTDNNYTTTEKNKLSGIASGAQANVIESVKVNGTALTVTSKAVDVSVPTATSDLTNDSGFITSADVPEGASASTATPLMDGTAAVGTSTAFARGDHVHPSDTSKANASDLPTFKNEYNVSYPITSFTETANNTVVITSGESNVASLAKTAYVDAVASAAQTALNGKADAATTLAGYGITNAYTKTEVDNAIGSAVTNMYKYKGSVATVSALPSSGNTTGDVYDVQENDMNYAWNGTAWDALGEVFSITAISNSEITSIVNQVFAS